MIKYKFNILKEILIVFRSGVYLKEGIFLLKNFLIYLNVLFMYM